MVKLVEMDEKVAFSKQMDEYSQFKVFNRVIFVFSRIF
jgi:hypothetical protein